MCPLCGKIFAAPANVKVHIDTVHNKLKRIRCRYCGRAFGQHSSRARHERMNCKRNANRAYYSNISYDHKINWRPIWRAELPLACSCTYNCIFTFFIVGQILALKNIQTYQRNRELPKIPPYYNFKRARFSEYLLSCPICYKMFASTKNVKVHINTVHKRLSPYSCRFCNKSFGQHSSRTRHERESCKAAKFFSDQPWFALNCKKDIFTKFNRCILYFPYFFSFRYLVLIFPEHKLN